MKEKSSIIKTFNKLTQILNSEFDQVYFTLTLLFLLRSELRSCRRRQTHITKGQAINFLITKATELADAEKEFNLDNLQRKGNLSSKDRCHQFNKIIRSPLSSSAQNTSRRTLGFRNSQTQSTFRMLDKQFEDQEYKHTNKDLSLKSSRINTTCASTQRNFKRFINLSNINKINSQSQLDKTELSANHLNITDFQINLGNYQNNLTPQKMPQPHRRNLRKSRPMTANVHSPREVLKNKQPIEQIEEKQQQDVKFDFSFVVPDQASKSRQSNRGQQHINLRQSKRLRPYTGYSMNQTQIISINRNKVNFINLQPEPSEQNIPSVWNCSATNNQQKVRNKSMQLSQSNVTSPQKPKRKQIIKVLQFNINAFLTNQYRDRPNEIERTLQPYQIQQLYQAKLVDNNLNDQDQQFSNFEKLCNAKCIDNRIILTDQYLGENSAKVLAQIILENSNLSQLSISRNRIGDNGVALIGPSLARQYHLISIDVSNNQITHHGVQTLFQYLQMNQSVVDINLASNEGPFKNLLGKKGAFHISKYFKDAHSNSFLSFLNLKGCALGNEGIISLSEGLKSNQSLISLNVKGNLFGVTALRHLVESLPRTIKELDISDNIIKDQGLSFLCNHILYHTTQHNHNQIPAESDSSNFMSGVTTPKSSVIDFKENIPILEILNLSKCGITFEGLEQLFKHLRNDGTLTKLTLDNNSFLGASNFLFVEQFLIWNNTLEILSMNGCSIEEAMSEAIGKGLAKNVKIKELYLSENQINEKGAKFISRALMTNIMIQVKILDLSKNCLRDKGAKELSFSIKLNKSLENLNIEKNEIFVEGGSYLASSMLQNHSIKSIKADNNIFYIRYSEKMKQCSMRNAKIFQEQQFPRIKEERDKLFKVKAQKVAMSAFSQEIDKQDEEEKMKLAKTQAKYEDMVKYEEKRHKYLLSLSDEFRQDIKEKENELLHCIQREKYAEANGDKQIRELLHFAANFEKDKAYMADDINYKKDIAYQRRTKYEAELDQLAKDCKEVQTQLSKAKIIYEMQENELQKLLKKRNIQEPSSINFSNMMTTGKLDFNFVGDKIKVELPARRDSRSQSMTQNYPEKAQAQNSEPAKEEEIAKKKKKSSRRKKHSGKRRRSITLNDIIASKQKINQSVKWHGKDACEFKVTGLSTGGNQIQDLEVVIKRFSEKLLIVMSDGQKFGNVITASYQKNENEEEVTGMFEMDYDQQLDNLGAAQEDENDGIEYNSQLLLGDRNIQDWLQLFSQSLLKSLLEIPICKDIQSIVVTLQIGNIRKLDKKTQFALLKKIVSSVYLTVGSAI